MAWLVIGRATQAEAVFDEMLRRWPERRLCAGQPLACARASRPARRGHRRPASAGRGASASAAPPTGSTSPSCSKTPAASPRPSRRSAAPSTLDPKLDRAWYGLGLVLIRLQRPDEAVAALKQNTKLQPMSPYGWYQLARVHVDRREPEEARKIIRHLKGFEPKVAAQLERETGLLA